jgi:hypothetical protein
MLPYHDSRLTKIILVIFFVLVLGYGYFEAQGFLRGPSIQIASGTTVVHDQLVRIQGKAARISSLSMNGKQIQVTEDGSFDQPYLLSEGVNRIVLDAKDTYGRTTRQVIQIVYVPSATSSALEAATSTAGVSTPPTGGPVAQ